MQCSKSPNYVGRYNIRLVGLIIFVAFKGEGAGAVSNLACAGAVTRYFCVHVNAEDYFKSQGRGARHLRARDLRDVSVTVT